MTSLRCLAEAGLVTPKRTLSIKLGGLVSRDPQQTNQQGVLITSYMNITHDSISFRCFILISTL